MDFMNNKLLYTLITASVLTACGGSDSSPETSPEVNIAPVAVDDFGLVQDNQSTLFDVLENDTDSNNDSLLIETITIEPQNGTAGISENKISYTPNTDFAGVDVISYRVSDGVLTSEASVDITVNHTMTISGTVTDSPISDASVTLSLGGQDFIVIADSGGNYELPITINNLDDIITLKAVGNVENNQANVELLSTIGEAKSLLGSIDSERRLTNEASNLTNITHVSTASYLLVKDRNNNEEVTTLEQLMKLKGEVSPEQLLETAGFIKLLIDNPSFQIPEGETLLSVLESPTENGQDTSEAIKVYLSAHNLLDENGEATAAFELALESAIEETVADPAVVEQFSTDMFIDKKIIELYGAKQGWNELIASGWSFNSDGTATFFRNVYNSRIEPLNASWKIADGKLELEYSDLSVSYPYVSYPFDNLVSYYGFDQALQDALIQAVEAGQIYHSFLMELHEGFVKQTATLLTKNDTSYQVSIDGDYLYKMIMPAEMNWQGDPPTSKVNIDSTATYSHNRKSLFDEKTIDDLIGKWVMNFDYSAREFFSDEIIEGFWGDRVTVTANTTLANRTGYQFTSKLDAGVFVMTAGDTSYRVTPFKQEGNNLLATTEKWVNGKLAYFVAGQIAKFDTSYQNFTETLVTELPEVQLSIINGYIENQWHGDKLKLENVWGHHFKTDGSLIRGIYGVKEGEDSWDGIEGEHFYLGYDQWTWDKTDNIVNLRLEDDRDLRHRTWEVLSMDEQGRVLVFEYSIRGRDFNGDGQVTDEEIGQFIPPRINTIMKDDLSRWEDAWNNTVNGGVVPAQAGSTVVTSLKPQALVNKPPQERAVIKQR